MNALTLVKKRLADQDTTSLLALAGMGLWEFVAVHATGAVEGWLYLDVQLVWLTGYGDSFADTVPVSRIHPADLGRLMHLLYACSVGDEDAIRTDCRFWHPETESLRNFTFHGSRKLNASG
ncbi:MAG: hypothetical protein LIP23_09550, partial [Planctomycetes bacterium]|nr:hypothetical protein [Planctomycetota bacterium]